MGPDPLIDSMAGNYRLVARLGAGGMGEVYKGVHDTIGAKVAIKLLHATAARDRALQERFLIEAKAVNRIEHPGVVKVIDAGRMDNGRPYLVMELLDGASLHELRKAGRLAIPEACRAMVDVLDALAAAHAAGVIHRDLKPANLFRTRDGRTVVLDFGVAKLMASDAPVRLTLTGSAIGTPHYMAPEQIRGKPVTPAADIYAAGVVLFELLCGRRPFDNTDEESVMVAHLERRPPPPRALEPAIPPGVQDVILAALQKDPAKRPPSAAAMRDALRAALDAPAEPSKDIEVVAATAPARSPWARPVPGESPAPPTDVPTRRASPAAPVPRTEPSHTPAAVVAHRQRAARLRAIALVAAAAFAVVGVVLVVLAVKRSRAEVAASEPTRSAPPSPSSSSRSSSSSEDDPWSVDVAGSVPTPSPGDAVPRCAQVMPSMVQPGVIAQVRDAIIASCLADAWPAETIACMVDPSFPIERIDGCLIGLTPAQVANLRARVDRIATRVNDADAGTPPADATRPARPPRIDAGTTGEADAIDLKDPFATPRPAPPRDTTDDLLEPSSSTAKLSISSTPPGADVTIDGKRVGTTPLVIVTSPRAVTVVLGARGYKSKRVGVKVGALGNVLHVTLDRLPAGATARDLPD